ncbi:hypothetical protein VB774_23370 [Pseudanabaena galeata UHCC 0370]|uniref:Uncharacterized protein n=1 Tax=Pseudanabaena galeata UHCC 0370 TaxID=3110310 RepID=A0ABU5TQN3_9CYAN|nr:hypothetical protein [Pseudanabaena galeata]MEA5480587.1 hypothetical protein [Pseudanabaena galeata UHCC 0370]
MKTSGIGYDFGSILEVDETPFKRVSYWELLPIALLYGSIWLIPFTLLGCPFFALFLGNYAADTFACRLWTETNAFPSIIKSALFCQTIYFILLVWATWRKSNTLKYAEKTVVCEHGFHSIRFIASPTDPSYIFKDLAHRVVSKYSDFLSSTISISDKLDPKIALNTVAQIKIDGNDKLLIRYTLLNNKKSKAFKKNNVGLENNTFVSRSRKLAEMALASLETRLWSEIESKICRGEQVNFGKVDVCNDYLYLIKSKSKFLIRDIKEVLVECNYDGESNHWDFSIRFKEKFNKVSIEMNHVENTHLFLRALDKVGIKIDVNGIYNIGLDPEMVVLLKRYASSD